MVDDHSHVGVNLRNQDKKILENGIEQVLKMTEDLDWKKFPSESHPLPLTQMLYSEIPTKNKVRDDILDRYKTDPVSILENVLSLVELYISNQSYAQEIFIKDMPFIKKHCFGIKRINGWVATHNRKKSQKIEQAINDKWQFKFHTDHQGEIKIYSLLSMLVRYSFIFGGFDFGDAHAMTHFIEDFAPGVIIYTDEMSDLDLTLSVASMKIGVPIIVPHNYPFTIGRKIHAESMEDISNAVVNFPSIRKLLKTPDIPQLPEYCSSDNRKQKNKIIFTIGDTKESFILIKKGNIFEKGFKVDGELSKRKKQAIGILITISDQPVDAYDVGYIEKIILSDLSLIEGVVTKRLPYSFEINLEEEVKLGKIPEMIGEVLLYSLHHHFPKIKDAEVNIILDKDKLNQLQPSIKLEKIKYAQQMNSTTEETIDQFYKCNSCSAFAPNHICIVTPERPPQCGKSFGQVKVGALYEYDDMTNVHHNPLHLDMNLYGVVEKGKLLDSVKGEWDGVNRYATNNTKGRTSRIFLHDMDDYPHTSCSCFRLIIFRMDKGIGIMDYSFKGKSPDGRNWRDLHYQVGGKQVSGIVTASFDYLLSQKFLAANGGWRDVIWVSSKVADRAKQFMHDHIEVAI